MKQLRSFVFFFAGVFGATTAFSRELTEAEMKADAEAEAECKKLPLYRDALQKAETASTVTMNGYPSDQANYKASAFLVLSQCKSLSDPRHRESVDDLGSFVVSAIVAPTDLRAKLENLYSGHNGSGYNDPISRKVSMSATEATKRLLASSSAAPYFDAHAKEVLSVSPRELARKRAQAENFNFDSPPEGEEWKKKKYVLDAINEQEDVVNKARDIVRGGPARAKENSSPETLSPAPSKTTPEAPSEEAIAKPAEATPPVPAPHAETPTAPEPAPTKASTEPKASGDTRPLAPLQALPAPLPSPTPKPAADTESWENGKDGYYEGKDENGRPCTVFVYDDGKWYGQEHVPMTKVQIVSGAGRNLQPIKPGNYAVVSAGQAHPPNAKATNIPVHSTLAKLNSLHASHAKLPVPRVRSSVTQPNERGGTILNLRVDSLGYGYDKSANHYFSRGTGIEARVGGNGNLEVTLSKQRVDASLEMDKERRFVNVTLVTQKQALPENQKFVSAREYDNWEKQGDPRDFMNKPSLETKKCLGLSYKGAIAEVATKLHGMVVPAVQETPVDADSPAAPALQH